MICKRATISHSGNALDYCEKGGELLHANGVHGNAKEINKQFKEVQDRKPNIKHKSVHAIISLNPKDRKLNKGELIDISEKYAKEHGFDRNQYAVYLHEDKAHRHLHIVANRIGLDRKVVSSSHGYTKNMIFSKRMEEEYNLISTKRPVKNKTFEHNNEFSQTLKGMVDTCLKKSKSMKELETNLKEQFCVTMYIGRGVSFMYQEGKDKAIKTKGSALGREYSLKGLEKQIENLHFPKEFKLSDNFMQKLNTHLDSQKPSKAIEIPSKSTGTNLTNDIEKGIGGLMGGLGSGEDESDDLIKRRKKKRNKFNQGGMNQ